METEKEQNHNQIKPPPPGSDLAIDEYSCICAYWDNHRGIGRWDEKSQTFLFWITEDCPLHDKSKALD